MNSRQTWFWLMLAGVLLAAIYVLQLRKPKTPPAPPRVVPEIKIGEVTAIQVRPGGPAQLAIRAERNGETNWNLTEPVVYPARGTNIERLIASIATLQPDSVITASELRSHTNVDAEFGFSSPQAAVIVQQGDYRAHMLVGALTTPGDQVYLQIVGHEGVYITDSQWLTNLPKSPNDWRDRAVVREDLTRFDSIAVTNSGRAFVLQRDPQQGWRMVWPLNPARADSARVGHGLAALEKLQVRQFVSEDAKTEAENTGLANPILEVGLGTGTNQDLLLQFGKNPATATNQIFARRAGKPSIFTVDSDGLAPWRTTSVNDFRDPHLLTIITPLNSISVRAEETFSIERSTNDTWRVLPDGFPADPDLILDLVSNLVSMQVVQFTKDVVNAPDLPEFGLATPARQYTVKCVALDANPTNCLVTDLTFGTVTNQPDKVFVRRADESSVYAISTNDLAQLPTRQLVLRDRKYWAISENDVASLIIREHGKDRGLVRRGAHQWSFAGSSQGILNDLAVEETVKAIIHSFAVRWLGRGDEALQQFGFKSPPYAVVLKLKSGEELEMQFGPEMLSKNQCAAVKLEGQWWVFEMTGPVYRDVAGYLSIP